MRMPALVVLGSLLLGVSTASHEPPPAPNSSPVELAVGDPAPLFSLKGTDGRTYRLADYKGKQAVVLAWFAKAFSGG